MRCWPITRRASWLCWASSGADGDRRPRSRALVAESRRSPARPPASTITLRSTRVILVAGVLGLSLTDVVTRGRDLVTEADSCQGEGCRRAAERARTRLPHSRRAGVLWPAASSCRVKRWSRGRIRKRSSIRMIPYLRRTVATKGSCRHRRSRHRHRGDLPGAACHEFLKRAESATDISEDALATASANAAGAWPCRVVSRLCAATGSTRWRVRFDAIVSNPPYIPSNVVAELEPEVRLHDPCRGARWRQTTALTPIVPSPVAGRSSS